MPTHSSPASRSTSARSASKSSGKPARGRAAGVVGAVVGAVVGGVVGAVLVKKVRAEGVKSLVPKKVPEVGRRTLTAVKSLAHDASVVAKATAGLATGAALSQAKSAAQQFVVDVATGTPPSTPKLAQPRQLKSDEGSRPPRHTAPSATKKSARTTHPRKAKVGRRTKSAKAKNTRASRST